MSQKEKIIEELIGVIEELREKCPWDKKQTINSLRHLTIEEVYELSDAIIAEDNNNIEEELGDVLLHMLKLIVQHHDLIKNVLEYSPKYP